MAGEQEKPGSVEAMGKEGAAAAPPAPPPAPADPAPPAPAQAAAPPAAPAAAPVPAGTPVGEMKNSLGGDTYIRLAGGVRFVDAVRGLTAETLGQTLRRALIKRGKPLAVVAVHILEPAGAYKTVARRHLYDLGEDAAHCLVIGRWETSDIQINEPHVSRYHGVIAARRTAGSAPLVLYRDVGTFRMGSTNGTVVNGSKRVFDEMITIAVGDELGVGYLEVAGSPRQAYILRIEPPEA